MLPPLTRLSLPFLHPHFSTSLVTIFGAIHDDSRRRRHSRRHRFISASSTPFLILGIISLPPRHRPHPSSASSAAWRSRRRHPSSSTPPASSSVSSGAIAAPLRSSTPYVAPFLRLPPPLPPFPFQRGESRFLRFSSVFSSVFPRGNDDDHDEYLRHSLHVVTTTATTISMPLAAPFLPFLRRFLHSSFNVATTISSAILPTW